MRLIRTTAPIGLYIPRENLSPAALPRLPRSVSSSVVVSSPQPPASRAAVTAAAAWVTTATGAARWPPCQALRGVSHMRGCLQVRSSSARCTAYKKQACGGARGYAAAGRLLQQLLAARGYAARCARAAHAAVLAATANLYACSLV
jgi:hypothetical protein